MKRNSYLLLLFYPMRILLLHYVYLQVCIALNLNIGSYYEIIAALEIIEEQGKYLNAKIVNISVALGSGIN